MGQNNYHSRWHPRLPRVGAAPTRDPSPKVKPLDRVLPALHLHLAPVFASSFSRSASVKSMATYGKRGRGTLPFSVFRDEHEAHSHSKLQKRPPPQPTFVSSTPSDDPRPADLSRPLANPDLPRHPESRLSSREPPATQHRARRSLQPLSTHLGRAPELTSASAPRSTARHARSTSACADGAIIHRLSSSFEPAGTPLSRRAPAALSHLWSTPSSPELSPVTCQRASQRVSGIDELPTDHYRSSRPFATNSSAGNPTDQQSLSDHSDTLTTNTSSLQHPASDLTDATLTDAFTDTSPVAPRQKFSFRNRRAARQAQKMDSPTASTVERSPNPGDPDQLEPRNTSSTSLLNKFSGILGEKTTNLKRSLPFKAATTPPKPAEKMSIGAPFDARQGPRAMSTPPRRPNAGEDTRTWGAPDLVNTKPQLPEDIEDQPKSQVVTTTNDNWSMRDTPSASPVYDTMRLSEAERKNNSSVGKQSLGRSSPPMTALPTRPPASIGLRGWVASAHRLSRLALNDQFPSTSSDKDSGLENAGDTQQQQQEQEQSRSEKPSIFERMKDTLRVRRHKRSNTTVQTAVDLRVTAPQSNLRASRSAAVLTSPLALRPERSDEVPSAMRTPSGGRMTMRELPPINSGPAITISSMDLLQSPRTVDHDVPAPASKSSPEVHGSRSNEELPAFAKETSMPEGIEVSGHNGIHRMNPLRSHTNVMEFAEAPSVAGPARMAAIPEDKAECVASEGSNHPATNGLGGGSGGSVFSLSNVGNHVDSSVSPAPLSVSDDSSSSDDVATDDDDHSSAGQHPHRKVQVIHNTLYKLDEDGIQQSDEEIPNPVAF
ncbi:proteophosphoglycan ppg4 [Diplodia corticola]|uniref:Proteophosphoglycan ppg4 n=1 Tax=Diplodia corticola TaxID=236234 RepID=A0A1J9QX13_9PEZI|nr:proteophosphoglycan ppg4 [Diplodia corticola]OJD33542.1 proteophosphoglycan ppg4 [Diplodia corticola]